ncbi:hypothetical protein AUJ59_00955 [Candidatus Beckwithbacteria bacterium CG1_02_47_37]|uniref:SGNH hydrolase-type esterase domain-containing protein n=1 Tax=Candidatus Beckwithbacteria bacterium CG1_02_47_37 TaxID=1805034 RepID=A0A1J4RRU6_9BACT|nr:MAG: hypothetical protein AUJ59_00955 [Candidatus Beckwithbacteria bacterium CG1_02_47_37]PIR57162.1 MAG: hypothetical protein COU72_02440 [Parcubacteria group bacterium CG10_big_fil_rev_8_21_14_0_10_41_35]
MKLKDFLVNLGIALGGLLALVLVLEIVFRLPLVQQKTGGNWPKLKTWMDDVWYNERNSLGFRDREHSFDKPEDTYRILILGDSIAYGQMVEFKDIFPVRLEEKLNETGGQAVEVINMSLMGWNTVEQLQVLTVYGLRFQPDLVVIGFYLNDPQVKHNSQGKEVADAERQLLPFFGIDQWLNGRYYFYSFVHFRYNRFLEKIGHKDDYKTWQKSLYDKNQRGWKDFVFALDQIKRLSGQNQAKLLFVSLNVEPGWEKETTQVLNLVTDINLPVLDMRPFFQDYDFSDLVVSPSDWHPNAQAHQIYTQVLGDYIVDKILNIH